MDCVKLDRKIHEFSLMVMDVCELDSASVFLCDRTAAKPHLSYLLHIGIPDDAQDKYDSTSVYLEDPYVDPNVQERLDRADDCRVLTPADHRVKPIAERSPRYMHFMAHFEIDVIGASTRRLLPGVYSTIGFHRQKKAKPREPVSIARLDDMALRLQDMVAGQMLREVLSQTNGLATFRSSYFPRVGADSGLPLSPREKEIATLVCRGRLNKEIAYLIGLSENTVENHLRRIYAKLSIHNRSSLVALMSKQESGATN